MGNLKGFITVATGNERYYILAHNLLQSYRYHSGSKTPFAILCDRENEWTADFDQVVIIENPAHSYIDKLRILDLSPFDETIFIDADSLAYKDLNGLWAYFKDSPDIGLLGRTFPADSEKGWWQAENLGELKDKVDYKVICQGGVYYVRNNGKDLPAIKETCRFIAEHYMEYHFSIFETILEDETILCLAAALHHIRPVSEWFDVFAYYPEVVCLSLDIRSGHLRYIWTCRMERPNRKACLIHFGTVHTISSQADGIYYREVARLKMKPDRLREIKNRLIIVGRRFVNRNILFKALANLFPKEFRNKYNDVIRP